MSDGLKKPHRYAPGERAKLRMKSLRFARNNSQWDKPGMSLRSAERAFRSGMSDIQEANERLADIGRLGTGVVRRLRQVLEIRLVRLLEASRLVRDAGKPRPGQVKLLQARHVNAMRLIPDIMSGRALADLSYVFHTSKAEKKKKAKAKRRRAKQAAALATEPASGEVV